MTAELGGQELVGYVFAPAEADAHAAVRELWKRCRTRLAAGQPIPPYREEPHGLETAGPGQVVCAAQNRERGVHQVLLRRTRDLLVLGVVRSPGVDDSRGWELWERDWETLVPETGSDPWVGTARILQSCRPGSGLDLDLDLDRLVDRLPVAEQRPWHPGAVVTSESCGRFAVWESQGPPEHTGGDLRPHRRLAVIADHGRDADLSAWTWAARDGTAGLTSVAASLGHAALVRQALRQLPDPGDLRKELSEADDALDELVREIDQAGEKERNDDALVKAISKMVVSRAGESGLIRAAGRRRRIASVVEVAAHNMSAHLDLGATRGPFADDRSLGEWGTVQLRRDLASLQDRIERGGQAVEQADRILEQRRQEDRGRREQTDFGAQRRRERFNLSVTGAVGAVLMALAAVQALDYDAPVPAQVQGAVVAALGAFALLASLAVLRIGYRANRWANAAVVGAGVLLGAAGGWVISSVLSEIGHRVGPATQAWSAAGGGAVIALALTALARRATRAWRADTDGAIP